MKKYYALNYLSGEFYADFNSIDYPEIEHKTTRPYMVLLINLYDNTFAIPFRTNIRHGYCYKFKNSGRDSNAVSGLDFTKAVIVNDNRYIGASATIDDKEFVELNSKYRFIIKKFKNYVDGYIEFINGKSNDYSKQKYKYSTLQYFQKEFLKTTKLNLLSDKLEDAQIRSNETINVIKTSKEYIEK